MDKGPVLLFRGIVLRLLPAVILTAGFGCSSLPLAREPARRSLRILNPSGKAVRLTRVGGGTVDLGRAQRIELVLEADRYVVDDGAVKCPAPLLEDVVAEDQALTLVLVDDVAAPEGYVYVPGGPALVGDVLGVGAPDERPARVVDIEPFFLAERETTNAEFAAFLNAVGRCDETWIDLDGPKCRIERSGEGRFRTDAPDEPVVTVSLPGALAYCAWRTSVTGSVHRLPTEEEWEKAARGPSSSTYAYGDVYTADAANQESGVLMRTARFPATGWGFFDLTGNAFEWTSSEYAPGLQVLRGGSYVLDGPYLRNSFRMWYRPLVQADDMGFRVLREIR